jgi:hypothetical protein
MGTTFAKTNRRLRNFTRERRRLKQEARKKAGAASAHAAGVLRVSGARTGKSKSKALKALGRVVAAQNKMVEG